MCDVSFMPHEAFAAMWIISSRIKWVFVLATMSRDMFNFAVRNEIFPPSIVLLDGSREATVKISSSGKSKTRPVTFDRK